MIKYRLFARFINRSFVVISIAVEVRPCGAVSQTENSHSTFVTLTTLTTVIADREFLVVRYLFPVSSSALLFSYGAVAGLSNFTVTFHSIDCIHTIFSSSDLDL